MATTMKPAPSRRKAKDRPASANGTGHVDPGSNGAAPGRAFDHDLPVIELGERELSLDQLERHPRNRHPTPEQIAERASSMLANGQLERIVARRLGVDRFQIVSGETRWLAAGSLEWETITARVIECTDAQALKLLAEYNAHRSDLTPIDKARLIDDLCKPITDGGGGLTREAAAHAVGLNSHSSASNLVRLLKLPQAVQEAIAEGRLPETYVRPLLPLLDGPARSLTEKAMASSLKKAKDVEVEYTRESFSEAIVDDVARACGDMDPASKHTKENPWMLEHHDHHCRGRLFERLDADTQARLQVVELPALGKHGFKSEIAVNKKLYNELQKSAAAELLKKLKSRSTSSAKSPSETKQEVTPAQKRAAAKKAAEQLNSRIKGFRHRWLKSILTKIVRDQAAGHDVIVARLICWMSLHPLRSHDLTESGAIQRVCKKADIVYRSSWTPGVDIQAWKVWARGSAEDLAALRSELVLAILEREDKDPCSPMIDERIILDLIAEAKVDLEKLWLDAQDDKSQLLRDWCELMTTDQLRRFLGNEWRPITSAKQAVKFESSTRKTIVECLATRNWAGYSIRPKAAADKWPLPKALAIQPEKKRGKREA